MNPQQQPGSGTPTPEIWYDPQTLNPLERRINDAVINLQQQHKLDTTASDEQQQTLLSKFYWDDPQLTTNKKAQVEHLLVKYHNNFACHRLHIGFNTEIKVKLTAKHDNPV